MGSSRFDTSRAQDEKNPTVQPQKIELAVASTRDKEVRAAVDRARVVAHSVAGTRDLINAAPNDLPPAEFADRARAAIKGTGLKIEGLDEKPLAAGGYGEIGRAHV